MCFGGHTTRLCSRNRYRKNSLATIQQYATRESSKKMRGKDKVEEERWNTFRDYQEEWQSAPVAQFLP
jgi:hypothetical protein